MNSKDIYSIYETLEERDKKFWDSWLSKENGVRIKRIRDYVENKWRAKPDIKFFPSHNHYHSMKVEDNIHLLLPGNTFGYLCEEERFLLIASAWLHDLGMMRGLLKEDESDIEDDIIRTYHAERAIEYIKRYYEELKLTLGEVIAIEYIIKYHTSKTIIADCPDSIIIGHHQIRLQLLAAYLRLADAIHIDESRIDTFLYRIYRSDMPVISKLHWVVPKMISGIYPNPVECCLEISLNLPKGWKQKRRHIPLLGIFKDGLEKEIEIIKNTMVRGGITAYLDVRIIETETTSFPLNVEEDLRRVIDSIQISQYPNASRLIEGILEEILLFCKQREDPGKTIIQIKNYLEDKLTNDLKKRSTHLGAIKIVKEFLNLIYERGDENIKDIKVNQMHKLEKIEADANYWLDKKAVIFDNISEKAKEIFEEDEEVILVYGYSGTVLSILKSLKSKKKKEIYVVECRNKTLYSKYGYDMAYNDGIIFAEEIANMGYPKVYLISDASVAHYMVQGVIKKVLLGANGVLEKKGNLHSVGHLMVSVLAKYYDIPVYVAAEKLKFGGNDDIEINPEEEKETSWLPEGMFKIDLLNKIIVKKPRNDIVPFKLIKAFITEEGVKYVEKE